jgi:hypothetical protein
MRQRYAEFRVAGYSMVKAAISAGYSWNGASARATKLEARSDVQDYKAALMEGFLSEELKKSEVGRAILKENAARSDHSSLLSTLIRTIVANDFEIITLDPKSVLDVENNTVRIRDFADIKKRHRRTISKVTCKPGEFGNTISVEFKDDSAAKNRILSNFGPAAKVEVMKMLAELKARPSDSLDKGAADGGAKVVIENYPNGRCNDESGD